MGQCIQGRENDISEFVSARRGGIGIGRIYHEWDAEPGTDVQNIFFSKMKQWPIRGNLEQRMVFVFPHGEESFEMSSAKHVEKCGFDAIRQIVSEDDRLSLFLFYDILEFCISSCPQCLLSDLGYFRRPGRDDELASFEEFLDEFSFLVALRPDFMITMYQNQIL